MDMDFVSRADVRPDGSLRLLVVDDDTVHRMVLCRIGRQAGYAVDEAASYESACRRMDDNAYACVTVDLALGEHGGIELLRHLARVGFKAPVIIVTGSDEAVRNDAFVVSRRLGLNTCEAFAKPVKLAVLRELLEEVHKRQVVGLTPRIA